VTSGGMATALGGHVSWQKTGPPKAVAMPSLATVKIADRKPRSKPGFCVQSCEERMVAVTSGGMATALGGHVSWQKTGPPKAADMPPLAMVKNADRKPRSKPGLLRSDL
jgi:hypothetical protein